jgi:hypothetical protein
MSHRQNYCGANLLRCRSLESSTYIGVRLTSSLTCALHIDFLITFCKRLV